MPETPPKREWKKQTGPPEETPIEEDFRKGRRSTYQPPERVRETNEEGRSIDPGPIAKMHLNETELAKRFPELAPLIAEMDKIEAKEFDFTVSSNAEFADLVDIARLTKEKMLMEAIVGDWDEKTLLEEYREEMALLNVLCHDESWLKEGGARAHDAWQRVTEGRRQRPGSKGFNEHIQDRQLAKTPQEIAKAKTKLLKFEQGYKKKERTITSRVNPLPDWMLKIGDKVGITDMYEFSYCVEMKSNGECAWNQWEPKADFNPDRLDYVINVAVPFYRDYIVNKGIVENWTYQEIQDEFMENANRSYLGACNSP